MLPFFSQSEYLSIFLLLPQLLLRVTFFTFSFISVVISFGFDWISFLLLWLLMWFSLFILQLWLSSKLSHVKNIFLCNVRIFPFRFPFWLHFLSYILVVKVLHDHIYFVFPERLHFLCSTSFRQVSYQCRSPFLNTAVHFILLSNIAMSLCFLQDQFFDVDQFVFWFF